MSQQAETEKSARELAHACLTAHQSALEKRGLRADVKIERRDGESLQGSEIRITFWRGNDLADVIEDFIFRVGQPTGSPEELERWLDESIDDVLAGLGPNV
jgi:hypothetical protein